MQASTYEAGHIRRNAGMAPSAGNANNNHNNNNGERTRAPGSFSTTVTPQSQNNLPPGSRPQIRRVESDSSDGSDHSVPVPAPLQINKSRLQQSQQQRPLTPGSSRSTFTVPAHSNSSSQSLQNFPRPSAQFSRSDLPLRTASPLTLSSRPSASDLSRAHTRKHSQSQGFFEPSLPTASFLPSNLGSGGGGGFGSGSGGGSGTSMAPNPNLTASQMAAQAAMHNQSQHMRQRSQTLPLDHSPNGSRRPSRGPVSPPLLSLTEASGERAQSGFGGAVQGQGQVYRNGLLGESRTAAAAAANVAFPRSPQISPSLPPSEFVQQQREPEKPSKSEKPSKVKLFSRPSKISTKEPKEKPMSSPNKFSQSMATLQRSNVSTASLAESTLSSSSSIYSMANSSSATIRPIDVAELKDKEKEKKHNFLSRQKHKLSNKDDHHLPLSSAASNSRPVDPNAPSSLYNFNLPPSPGPNTTSFAKSMSGLDLRHGGRALREKKKEEKAAAGTESSLRNDESIHQGTSEWPGPSSLGSAGASYLGSYGPPSTGYASSIYGNDVHADLAKYGLNNMTPDDAWPFLKAKLLIIFEGEDLRLPVEDFNRLVSLHLQRCIQKRAPNLIIEDARDLLSSGFSSLDYTLRRTPDERLIPHLVEMWLFTFTSILPYMQAVFLPLDLEFAGNGSLMSPAVARDFWGALPSSAPNGQRSNVPASQLLDVRRIVLTTYRDVVILPRFETLKQIFSRLSLESINTNLNLDTLSSSPSDGGRPGTAMSLDPSTASYSSQSTTLLGNIESTPGSGARSRAISNVSFGSDQRPFTPSAALPSMLASSYGGTAATHRHALAQREVNAQESSQVTETVGRMLQCMSVLSSVGYMDAPSDNRAVTDEGTGDLGAVQSPQKKMEELCTALKLNWLGRGRTGRNRRGLVGGRVRPQRSGAAMGIGERDIVEGSVL